jgi:hypothetical protein
MKTMREVRHITVAVTPELYLQTRKLAAEMDSTVTAMVAYLLERFPSYLKASGYSVTVPPGAPCHRAPRSTSKAQGPNCQGCGRDAEHPSPLHGEKREFRPYGCKIQPNL